MPSNELRKRYSVLVSLGMSTLAIVVLVRFCHVHTALLRMKGNKDATAEDEFVAYKELPQLIPVLVYEFFSNADLEYSPRPEVP